MEHLAMTTVRPEMRLYVVATKFTGAWPVSDDRCPDGVRYWPEKFDGALADARRKYCAGTHEMCQGREGELTIQFLIPRTTPTGARAFPVARTA